MFTEQINPKHEFLFPPISSSTVHKPVYRYKLLIDQNFPKIPFEYFKHEKKIARIQRMQTVLK